MGKFLNFSDYLLGLFCAAAFAFPAVASTVSVDVSPTTGYAVTNRSTVALPPRTTVTAVTTYNPTPGPLAGGGAYQKTVTGITITGVKGGTATTTMTGRLMAGASSMKNGLSRCLTSMRCNVALSVGAAGVQSLFDGIDWVMGEGGQIQKKQNYGENTDFQTTDPSCGAIVGQSQSICNSKPVLAYTGPSGQNIFNFYCLASKGSFPLTGFRVSDGLCLFGGTPSQGLVPVSASEIETGVNSNYTPDPSDLPYINTGGLDFGAPDVNYEITAIPPATSDSSTFTEYPDGTSKGSTTEFSFNPSNNPSKRPIISVDEKTTETTYSDTGQPTGTTTETTTTTGGGQPPGNDIENPTDCDFMPTVCRFLEWFQEPDPELSQEPDFSQLIDDIEIERDFQVGTSTASCPAPFQISLSWVPSVEVSLQPFCDLADLLRPFLLSLCFLYSGMIVLRT